MIYKCFSIYDSKVGIYHPFMFMRSKGEALRGFASVVNDPSTTVGKYPSDYTLFETGCWNDETCEYLPHTSLICLGVGHEFLKDLIFDTPSVANIESAKKGA